MKSAVKKHIAVDGRGDGALLLSTLFLVAVGIVMVYSSSPAVAQAKFEDVNFFLRRQLLRALVGLLAMWIAMRIDYHLWRRIAPGMLLAGIALLMAVLHPKLNPLGAIRGTKSWLRIASVVIQPAEAIKLILVIYLADRLSRRPDWLRSAEGFIQSMIVLGLVGWLIILQPDFGTASAILIIGLLMVFVSGAKIIHLAGLGATVVPICWLLVSGRAYWSNKVAAFLHSEGGNYHLQQSLISLGAGGWFGRGLGNGLQKFLFLPEPHTDFVLAILGEELGFLGTSTVLILFMVIAWRGTRTARRAPDVFGFLLAFGIVAMISVYVVLNVGVVSGLLPTTGLPLPLVSYGGSSLLFTLAGIGILLNISQQGEERPISARSTSVKRSPSRRRPKSQRSRP